MQLGECRVTDNWLQDCERNLFAKLETLELFDAVEHHLHQRFHLLHVTQAIGRTRPINNCQHTLYRISTTHRAHKITHQ